MNLDSIPTEDRYSLCYDPLQNKWLLTAIYKGGKESQRYIDTAEARWYQAIGAKHTTTPGVWIPWKDDIFQTGAYLEVKIREAAKTMRFNYAT